VLLTGFLLSLLSLLDRDLLLWHQTVRRGVTQVVSYVLDKDPVLMPTDKTVVSVPGRYPPDFLLPVGVVDYPVPLCQLVTRNRALPTLPVQELLSTEEVYAVSADKVKVLGMMLRAVELVLQVL